MKYFKSIYLLLVVAVLVSWTNGNRTGAVEIRNPISAFSAASEVNIADMRVVEGNEGKKNVEVLVIISAGSHGAITVGYATKNGTATAGSDYVATQGTVTFSQGDMEKQIKITVIGDVECEEDEKCEIVLSSASGAVLKDSTGTVTIVNDDCQRGARSGSSAGGGPGPGGGTGGASISVYEVRFTYTGYTSLFGGNPECGVRSTGRVMLTGLLAGPEKVADDDDFNYTGILQMDMNIDLCSVMRLPGTSEDKICAITMIGSGPVNTELEIYYDARGGYVKIEHKSGLFLRNAFGSCDNTQINEELDMIPNKTIASIFNGLELPMLIDRTLRVGRYAVTGEYGETVVEVLRKIQ